MSIFTGSFIPLPKFIYALRIWSMNKYVDFQEASGGPELGVTIDEGLYLPEDLASNLQTSLNATSGASGAYTVSFSRVTEKFTIGSDLAYLDLLWNSGANTASAAASALGFAASADSTGASSYLAPAILPNTFISEQPIRNPKFVPTPVKQIQVSDSGVRTANFRRMDRRLTFDMRYIHEQELKNNWFEMYIDEGVGRDGEVDYYPNSTESDYVRCYVADKDYRPREMVNIKLPAYYSFSITLMQKIPKGGTINFEDIYTRTL